MRHEACHRAILWRRTLAWTAGNWPGQLRHATATPSVSTNLAAFPFSERTPLPVHNADLERWGKTHLEKATVTSHDSKHVLLDHPVPLKTSENDGEELLRTRANPPRLSIVVSLILCRLPLFLLFEVEL